LDNLGQSITFSAQSVYEDQADAIDPRISVGYSNSFADDTIGVNISAAYSERTILEDRFWHWGYAEMGIDDLSSGDRATAPTDSDFPTGVLPWSDTPSMVEGEFERTSVAGAFQYQPNENLNMVADFLYSDFGSYSKEQKLPQRWEKMPEILPTDNDRGSNYRPFGAYDIEVDESNGRLTRASSYDPAGIGAPQPFEFSSREETNDLNTETLALGYNIEWTQENWSVSADMAYSKAESVWDMQHVEVFGDFYFTYDFTNVDDGMPSWIVSSDPNDPNGASGLTDPSKFYLRGFDPRHAEVEDEETSFKLDFDYDVNAGVLTTMEAGFRYADRRKTDDTWECDNCLDSSAWGDGGLLNVAAAGLPLSPMLGGGFGLYSGVPMVREWVSVDVGAATALYQGSDQLSKALVHKASKGFDISEESVAFYLKQNFEIEGDVPISGNIGLRVVRTNTSATGASPTELLIVDNVTLIDEGTYRTEENTYTEVLPSFNVRAELRSDLVLRGAIGKSLTRPDLDKLAPRFSYNASNPPTGADGNPDLAPFTAWNYDLSLEWYFNDSSYVSGGLFYKEVEGFVFENSELDTEFAGQYFASITFPDNAASADIYGFELGYQQAFEFLPEPFNGLGVMANYTYIDSNTEFNSGFEGAGVDTYTFEGLSKNNMNAVLFYEKGPFAARLSYNYRSEYLARTKFVFSSRSVDDYGQLDASFSYDINDNLSLTLEAVNLTQDEIEQYDSGDQDMRSVVSQTGTKFFLGLRGSF